MCILIIRDGPSVRIIILYMILQQNMDIVKLENDVDDLSEENFIGVKTDEVFALSFSMRKNEAEVSLDFQNFVFVVVRVCV